MTSPRLLGIGGAHLDRRGQVAGIYIPETSNPGTMREDVGGVVFNALRTAGSLGAATALLSIRGGDQAGERIAAAAATANIQDLSAVFLDRATASYTALIDREGGLIAGLADMGLYDLFGRVVRRKAARDAIAAADAVFLDANLPETAIAAIVAMARAPVHAIGISPAKIIRLKAVLADLSCLFMNRAEAETLVAAAAGAAASDLVEALRAAGLRSGIVTQGSDAAILFDADAIHELQPPPPRRIADVTGAGDALAGATVFGLMRGLPLREAIRAGAAAAMLALETDDAVPVLDPAILAEALQHVPEPRPLA